MSSSSPRLRERSSRHPGDSIRRPRILSELDALRTLVAGHLDIAIPLTLEELSHRTCITDLVALEGVLAQLEAKGQMLRVQGDRYGAKRIVARIHSRQRDRSRRSIEPVSIAAYLRFLVDYQHLGSSRLSGVSGLLAVVDQLQGLEAPAGAWEESILPARVSGYTTSMLDQLAANGEVGWARLTLRGESDDERRSGSTPSRATPVALFRRSDADWLLAAARGDGRASGPPSAPRPRSVPSLHRVGRCFSLTSPSGPAAYLSSSPRRSGTGSPGDWSPQTDSARCESCSLAAIARVRPRADGARDRAARHFVGSLAHQCTARKRSCRH